MLDFEAPVLDHSRSAILRRHIVGESSVEQRRIIGVGWWSETWKTRIQRLNGSEFILRYEIRRYRCSARQGIAEIRITERGIVDAVSAPNYRIGKPAKQSFRCVCESKSGTDVLVIGVCASCTGAI